MKEPVRVLCLFTIMDRGGAETMCMNLLRHIDRRKVVFDFLVYHSEPGEYDKEIESLGGRIYRIPNIRDTIRHINAARVFFKKHKEYKIVHNHMQSSGALICWEAKKAGIRTIVYHSHADINSSYTVDSKSFARRRIEDIFDLIAQRCSTDFFACGKRAASAIISNRNVRILHNAIDLDKFKYNVEIREKLREEYNSKDKFIIGNVARIDANKNQKFLLDLTKGSVKKGISTELWLIGDGEEKQNIELLIKKKSIEENVKLFGIRSNVNELLQAMDIFVLPSIAEGLPVSCVEAQAAGLPCVFSDGIDKETSIIKNNSILSLNDPIEEWVDTLLKYKDYKRKDTIEELRAAGYDIEETAKQMESFYQVKAKIIDG